MSSRGRWSSREKLTLALTASAVALFVASMVGGPAVEIGFTVLAVAFPPLLMGLGIVRRDGSLGAAAAPVTLLFILLELGFLGMLAVRGTVATSTWVLGLPMGAFLMLSAVFLAPLVLVALGYAMTFDSFGVDPKGLGRLRAMGEPPDSAR